MFRLIEVGASWEGSRKAGLGLLPWKSLRLSPSATSPPSSLHGLDCQVLLARHTQAGYVMDVTIRNTYEAKSLEFIHSRGGEDR